MTHEEIIVPEHVIKHKSPKKHLSPALIFIIVAFAAVIGYAAGVYHYQIEAAISPVFGYKAHSGEIDLSSLQQTYNKLASNYDGTLDVDKLIQGANNGLVSAAGDEYTVYMSPTETTDFNDSLSGNIGGGIGAVVGIRNSQITIMSVLDNNAAKAAGLMANDTIIKINDESTSGWTVDRAVGVIRGEDGTTVKLTILRGDVTKDYTVTRAIINNPSVVSSVTDGIGKMTITRFDEETGSLAKLAAQEFKKQNVKSIILDLRGNGGGYVDAARVVAGLWLNNKVVVTERSNDKVKSTIKSGSSATLNGIPTIVLVDGGSASASEIVAGALQDYGAAKLVGARTFGKGSVQQLLTLDGGAQLKVTIAKWYTPNGKNISKEGITPDNEINLTQADVDAGIDPQLNEAIKLLGQ